MGGGVTAPDRDVPIHVSVLDAELSDRAMRLYLVLRRHVDDDTLQASIGRDELARYLGMSRTKSVDPYVRELVDAGLLTSQRQWATRHGDDAVLTRDARHPVPTVNLYTVAVIAPGWRP